MAKSRPPYFPFYPLDFIGDPAVELMSTQAVGAYILLLCKAWHQDPPGSLPDDDRVLSRWARLSSADWSEVKSEVVRAFTVGSDGRLYQRRLQREYEAFREKSRKASKAASKRWEQSERNADAMRTQCERTARASGSGSGSDSPSPKGKGGSGGKGKRPREPDPIWDAVCEVFGLNPVTKSDKTRIGKVVRDLKAKGATPDDIRIRIDRYRRAWPQAADTPEAIVKHWDHFAVERESGPGTGRLPAPPGKYAGIGKAQNPQRAAEDDSAGQDAG